MKNLKSLRNENRVSQSKLAKAIGTSQQAVHRYEHCEYEPDIETMVQIAKYFGTSVDYLVGNTDIRNKIEEVEKHDLNKDESRMLDNYRKLSENQRRNISLMIDVLLDCGLGDLPGGYRIEKL
jgi:transcriptional regulator with XRE-family HTH domain